jgi:RsiW-degrading membrane proteinase PrsW (M82 family)
MTDGQYPPPPPPPSSPTVGFHGPKTNFFPTITSRLDSLEQQTLGLRLSKSVRFGLIFALLFSGTAGFLIAFAIEYPLPSGIALVTMIAPLVEEPVKAISMVIVAFFFWRAVPSRRYGAALGAASGLGFGVAESLLGYIIPLGLAGNAEAVATRILITPFMHPLWSAFVGIGVFTLAAKRSGFMKLSLIFSLLFLGTAYLNHICWNSLSLGLGYAIPSIFLVAFLTGIIVFPIFALILRDILGGHFNFQNFLTNFPEQKMIIPTPPPPPPQ